MSAQAFAEAPPGLAAPADESPDFQAYAADDIGAAAHGGHSSDSTTADSPPPKKQGHMKDELVREVTAAVREHVEKKTAASVDTLWLKGQKALQQMQQQQVTQTQELQSALSACAETQRKLEQENAMLRQALETLTQRLQTVFQAPLHMGQPAYLPAPASGSDAAQAAALAAVAAQATAKAAARAPPAPPVQSSAPPSAAEPDGQALRPSLELDEFRTPAGSPRRGSAAGADDGAADAGSDVSTPSAAAAPFTPPPAPKFMLTLRRADQVPLGLDVRGDAGSSCLLVDGVRPGGAVEAWNRQCAGDQREIRPGDRIVAVNGVEDADGMRRQCCDKYLLKIAVVRCALSDASTAASSHSHLSSPASSVFLRADADEFVPGQAGDGWSPIRPLPSSC